MLIAEIGNCHFGSIDLAKELIRSAIENGADLVKGQAFHYKDITGSMGESFYRDCQFNAWTHLELINYARDLGKDMFFSIFSQGYELVEMNQRFHKIAGGQSAKMTSNDLEKRDKSNYFISLRSDMDFWPTLNNAFVLYVTDYCAKDVNHKWFEFFRSNYPNWGYSDHSIDISNPISAIKDYCAKAVEVHFCMQKNTVYGDKIFRDTIFGKTPKELNRIARSMK